MELQSEHSGYLSLCQWCAYRLESSAFSRWIFQEIAVIVKWGRLVPSSQILPGIFIWAQTHSEYWCLEARLHCSVEANVNTCVENATSAACPNLMDFGGFYGLFFFIYTWCWVFSSLVSIAASHYSQPENEYGFINCYISTTAAVKGSYLLLCFFSTCLALQSDYCLYVILVIKLCLVCHTCLVL